MNIKFFNLPIDKQQKIVNAAYKVFSQNSYKKASMSEIADEGGISKALLFHYFTNKKELYMYLWNHSIEITRKTTSKYYVLDTDDFFEMLYRALSAKCSLMKKYPHIYAFSLNAYYEQLPDIAESVQKSYADASIDSEMKVFQKIDTSVFRSDIDLKLMYKEIMYAVDGYMFNKYRSQNIVVDEIEKEMKVLIEFWRKIYTHKEFEK
ncbi:TetR/AcrR family transcriptional regulator [Clostridium sp. AL.422]|uniref:TetR/AcrR family transcriptional regulator n=1 Tax=Clostridium TaxID=1485 RepID=UPI00293DFA13|nr:MULTISPECIES: TetR/AcrR family transcriptional regulator [unclassified Clostridium]MDV4150679.1 TetR/AcrR family transcriptional regulator [Clostridium sp. AL.422]